MEGIPGLLFASAPSRDFLFLDSPSFLSVVFGGLALNVAAWQAWGALGSPKTPDLPLGEN